MALSDTSPEAEAAYYRRLSEMTAAERVSIGVALWEAGHALQLAAMRRQYPDADEAEIIFRIAVTRFGEALARRVYGRE